MSADPSLSLSGPSSWGRSRASASLDLLRRLFRTRFGGIGLVLLILVLVLLFGGGRIF